MLPPIPEQQLIAMDAIVQVQNRLANHGRSLVAAVSELRILPLRSKLRLVFQGGNHVLQRMWSGNPTRAGLLPAVWPSGSVAGSLRARHGVRTAELRRQGEGARRRLVYLCRLRPVDRNRRAGLR